MPFEGFGATVKDRHRQNTRRHPRVDAYPTAPNNSVIIALALPGAPVRTCQLRSYVIHNARARRQVLIVIKANGRREQLLHLRRNSDIGYCCLHQMIVSG
jgi:hypothetical protein